MQPIFWTTVCPRGMMGSVAKCFLASPAEHRTWYGVNAAQCLDHGLSTWHDGLGCIEPLWLKTMRKDKQICYPKFLLI